MNMHVYVASVVNYKNILSKRTQKYLFSDPTVLLLKKGMFNILKLFLNFSRMVP